MAAKIKVDPAGEGEFDVTVSEGSTQSKHRVTIKASDYARLCGGKIEPECLIVKSFEFLLEQESKESILRRFDLLEIARYFPAFEREIRQRLALDRP